MTDASPFCSSYGYDALGNRTAVTYGNGTSQAFAYDTVSRLSSLEIGAAGTAGDLTETFDYNPASQITSQTRSNDAFAWTGHSNGTTPYTVNGLNLVTSIAGAAVNHDDNGNTVTDPAAGTNYLYTSENLLRVASGVAPIATLTYDPLMRLDSVIGNASNQGARFLYDGLDMIAEYNAAGALQKRYVFGPGIDEPLVEYDAAGNRTWLTADERGSIVARSNDAGTVTTINRYDEFGIGQGTNAGRFQYTGQMWVPELNAYYYKSRVYEPRIGRFLQPDVIGYAGGMNLYAYVLNDPVNLIDPFGLQACGVTVGTVCPPPQPGDIVVIGTRLPGSSGGGGARGGGGGLHLSPRRINDDGGGEGPQKEKQRASRTRSQCAAGTVGGGIAALALIPEAQGAALGVSLAAGEVIGASIITGGIGFIALAVGFLVYQYDQSHNNETAKAISKNTLIGC